MTKKQKLELTWVGKEERPRLEPRILIEEAGLSYAKGAEGIFDNRLIQGDNLLALKALESEYAGKVKCVFIDPPYNTGSAFEHYDDGLEHSIWLGMMRDRLELIRTLLSPDGSLWVTLDDNEAHYFKVMCDEVFGRENFRAFITWQKKYSVSNNFRGIASLTDYVLCYSKSDRFSVNLLPRSADSVDRYANPDDDPRGPWKAVDYLNQATTSQRPNLCYPVINPNTGEVIQNGVKAWKYAREVHERHVSEGRLWWGRNGKNTTPALKLFLSEVRDGMTPHNWWPHEEVGHTDEAKKESIGVFGPANVFGTPKPERLMSRILQLSTNPGDIVLDSFAGSGTTGAVAHKMGRRWIMVEIGDHARTHIVPRLRKVIDGEDAGGVTQVSGWTGGGGFTFHTLAPSLIEYDHWGNEVISKRYDATMLARALCKLEGFAYAPSEAEWWRHGYSTERDFIYVTTQTLTHDQLRELSDEVGPDRTLLVLCAAWRGPTAGLANLTVKKIPDHVRDRCEWGRDDYGLPVEPLPEAAE